jgi:ferredoxin-type protein NapG
VPFAAGNEHRKRGNGGLDAESTSPRISRKGFLGAVGGLLVMVALGGAAKAFSSRRLVRPPGGQDEASFAARCLKCDRCRSICPTGVIGIAQVEDGLAEARSPIMKFHLGACTFCGKCTEVCPTAALRAYRTTDTRFAGETVRVPALRIGLATVQKDRCIAWTGGTCAVCFKACPYGAITRDSNGRPIVDERVCNGCGVCVYVCPALTARSYTGGTVRGIEVVPTGRGGTL